jgi:FixJ family two-component response regulator
MAKAPLISVVDDDESVRESLRSLLRSVGFRAEAFASAEAFLNSQHVGETECLIVDVRMPGMSGLELQHHLAATNCRLPTVFITAHGDEQTRSRALKNGAVDFLRKPFSEQELLEAVHSALKA